MKQKIHDLPPEQQIEKAANLAIKSLEFLFQKAAEPKTEADRISVGYIIKILHRYVGKLNRLAESNPEDVSKVAKLYNDWPSFIPEHPALARANAELVKKIQLGQDHPLKRKGADYGDIFQELTEKLYISIETIRSIDSDISPYLAAGHKNCTLSAIRALPNLNQHTKKDWFDCAWNFFMEAIGGASGLVQDEEYGPLAKQEGLVSARLRRNNKKDNIRRRFVKAETSMKKASLETVLERLEKEEVTPTSSDCANRFKSRLKSAFDHRVK